MWLFLTVPWVGLQHVIVVFPDHTNLLVYVDQLDAHDLHYLTYIIYLNVMK